jgi:hypothetical protein
MIQASEDTKGFENQNTSRFRSPTNEKLEILQNDISQLTQKYEFSQQQNQSLQNENKQIQQALEEKVKE